MIRRAVPLALLFLAACSAEPEPADEQLTTLPANEGVEDVAPAPPEAPAPATLAGEWRVAGIDGEPFNESYGIALSADDSLIWWEPRCARMVRAYTIGGNAFTTEAYTDPQFRPAPGEPPPPVCAVAVPQGVIDVARALDAAERVERTPENGVRISGGGHSLTLFSQ